MVDRRVVEAFIPLSSASFREGLRAEQNRRYRVSGPLDALSVIPDTLRVFVFFHYIPIDDGGWQIPSLPPIPPDTNWPLNRIPVVHVTVDYSPKIGSEAIF